MIVELLPFIDKMDMFLNDSNWIAITLCGNDLSGEMSVSKMSKYIISPLAEADISILAISMYQCDYVLVCPFLLQ